MDHGTDPVPAPVTLIPFGEGCSGGSVFEEARLGNRRPDESDGFAYIAKALVTHSKIASPTSIRIVREQIMSSAADLFLLLQYLSKTLFALQHAQERNAGSRAAKEKLLFIDFHDGQKSLLAEGNRLTNVQPLC